MFEGVVQLSVWGYVAVTLLLTHITIASVTIYLHRHQAHRALDLHPALAHFFRFWLWLTTGAITKEWVAIHRKHHARVETPEDPHSPRIVGITKVLFQGWWVLYRREARNQETLRKYGHGTPDDWLERTIYSSHSYQGIGLMLLIDLISFGAMGLLIWGVQMLWIPIFAAGIINGVGHYWGYRNYACPDVSKNIVPWGIIIGGEELHNNHHAFASSAKLSAKGWEFDVGWLYIRILGLLGLAQVKKLPPKPHWDAGKMGVDLETVRALLGNRIHVMTYYVKEVLVRVYKEELRWANEHVKEMLKPMKSLLIQEEAQMDEEAKRQLEQGLEYSQRLAIVYQFKLRLQQLWKEKMATQEGLLQSLQEWCRQAEATGIKALQEFAQFLRGYTLQRV
jgi:stearoyl-CoA desaturase (delta-9 desaturase)